MIEFKYYAVCDIPAALDDYSDVSYNVWATSRLEAAKQLTNWCIGKGGKYMWVYETSKIHQSSYEACESGTFYKVMSSGEVSEAIRKDTGFTVVPSPECEMPSYLGDNVIPFRRS